MSADPKKPRAIRPPAVAGAFYPADPIELAKLIDGFMQRVANGHVQPSIVIAPHAGYVYSGPVAAYAFKPLVGRDCDGVIVLGFNHGYSYEFDGASIWTEGAWRTPLGDVSIDAPLARAIAAADPRFQVGRDAHTTEHSIEVMLPFLQRVQPGRPFVPISIGRPTLDNCRALADGLARAIDERNVVVIVSTDSVALSAARRRGQGRSRDGGGGAQPRSAGARSAGHGLAESRNTYLNTRDVDKVPC